jgi:gamma-glutamylcyclotransferase (GGCT)/AIG2-like uncharacterized protein YtfP
MTGKKRGDHCRSSRLIALDASEALMGRRSGSTLLVWARGTAVMFRLSQSAEHETMVDRPAARDYHAGSGQAAGPIQGTDLRRVTEGLARTLAALKRSRRTMRPLLFAYGTLMPADPEIARRDGWSPDAVRGRAYDLGPYPALVDLDDPTAGWVEGFVRPVEEAELTGVLDRCEGVDVGLYRRVETTTRNNQCVWVYVYARPLPPSARGPIDRWAPELR